jgi:glycosyltransferase involved in cell wall biosynthesis
MRVCLDARCVGPVRTGHGRYESELIRALAGIDKDNEYIVIRRKGHPGTVVDQANFTEVRLPGNQPSLRNLSMGAWRIGRLQADIYHSLHQFLPFGISRRAVATLHDLFRIEHPELIHSGLLARTATRAIQVRDTIAIPSSLRRADHVISVSRYSADRAEDRLKIDPDRITVIPHGVNDQFLNASVSSTPETGEADSEPYFVMVGDSTRHKNVHGAIDALGLLANRFPDVTLRVIGNGSEYRRLSGQISKLGLDGRVHLMNQVSDDEMIQTLRGAVALVFPSLLEGFGIPILEAQAVGCPVIASNNGAPAEVAGDVALLVDPTDSQDIASAMERLYCDSELRNTLSAKGRTRASEMTWQRAAVETIDVYEKVMHMPNLSN